MIDMYFFGTKKVELDAIRQQDENTWARELRIKVDRGQTIGLTLFAKKEEALKIEVNEPKKI